MQIAVSALRQAQDNYNAKLNTAIAEATRDADLDVAQYMCQKMAENGDKFLLAEVQRNAAQRVDRRVGNFIVLRDLV